MNKNFDKLNINKNNFSSELNYFKKYNNNHMNIKIDSNKNNSLINPFEYSPRNLDSIILDNDLNINKNQGNDLLF
jgi:hypothetical protein